MKKSLLFATIATTYIIQMVIAANKNGGTNVAKKPACTPKQYRAANGACTDCGAGILRCAWINNAKKVLACDRGKFVGKNGACEDCTAGCDVCFNKDKVGCMKPKAGFVNVKNPKDGRQNLIECKATKNKGGTAVAGCMKCQFEGRDLKCTGCEAGKYVHTAAAVGQNPPVVTCKACTTTACGFCPDDKCKKCKSTHFEDKTSGSTVCVLCSKTNGMNCGSNSCDAHRGCSKCAAQMSLVSNSTGKFANRLICKKCTDIDANCKICTATKCLACKEPFALSKDGASCAKIGSDAVDVFNCQSAQIYSNAVQGQPDVYKCNACNPKFFADATGTCQECPAGCLFCKAAGKCAICEPGTFWDADNTRCSRCADASCRVCSSKTKCSVCKPGMFPDPKSKTGGCAACHPSCAECVDGSKTGCLTCKGTGVLTTLQKALDVEYEDAKKLFDRVDKPPTGSELLDINFDMVRALKSQPKARILAKEKVSTQEKADFAALETGAKVETDKKSTDMSDDKALNEIWNSGGKLPTKVNATEARKSAEGKQKKVRKLVGMCQKECPTNKEGMGFFHDKATNICYRCKSDCQKCGMFEGECSTCGFGMYEVAAAATTEVTDDDGNVQELTTKTCAKCHSSCKRCTGPGIKECKGCAKGFQLRNKTCVAGSRCTSGEVQVDSADTECVEDDGTKCKECKACHDKNCHRCQDATAGKCMQCQKGFTRSAQGACIKCSKGCLKCKDASTCLMCDRKYFLLENAKNSNSSAKVMCVERCPVFYQPVPFKNLKESDKTRFKGDDGNADANDAIKNNQKKRTDYFKAKEDFAKGKISRADMEAKKTAVGTRLLAAPVKGGSKQKVMPNGKPVAAEDAGLKDLSDGQPLDDEVTKFVEFRGVCKPCTSSCGGGCAEGWFYREKKCVATCDKTGEVAVALDSFSVCRCPDGKYRDRKTQNCLDCQAGCSKCQDGNKCDQCGSSQFLMVNPLNKKRECVDKCPAGFSSVAWNKMSSKVKDVYTKDKKAEAKKAADKKFRLLAANATNATNKSLDANGFYKETNKTVLAKEQKLKTRNPLEEVEVFKAVTFAGMCQPCLKNCKECAAGFFLKEDGSCAKGCDQATEETIQDPTTKKFKCKKDSKPRLIITWGSKKDEKELMDDEKVNKRKADRLAAVSSGDAEGDLLDAAALGTDVAAEAEALKTGLQDPMEDLVLKAGWTQPQTGKFEYSWTVRQGVDDVAAFLKGINLNSNTLTVPSTNLVGVDLKAITIAVKAKQGDQRWETEFQFNMHKKPSIEFQMPDSIESGVRFSININFDGAKLDRADVFVMRVPVGGYQDPETGVVITEKDAKKQIEDVESKNSNKLYKKKTEEEEKQVERKAAGGESNELKRFRISKNQFKNGMKWWKQTFAVKPAQKDFNVLLKLKACGATGCFVRRKFLKVVKLSDSTRDAKTKENFSKMKNKDSIKTMDAEELVNALAMFKESSKGKKRSCKASACEVKDKSGKKVDTKEVEKQNAWKKKKADEYKKEFEKEQTERKAKGLKVQVLECPKGEDDTGAKVECSGAGHCTLGKYSGKGYCACLTGFAGRACQMSEQEKEEMKVARKGAMSKMQEDAKKGKIQNAKGQKDFLASVLADNDDDVELDAETAEELVKSQKAFAAELKNKFKRRKQGKTDASDEDYEMPTKEEVNDMMQQTMKLRKQKRLAKLKAQDEKLISDNSTNSTNGTNATKVDANGKVKLTKEQRAAKKAERAEARKAKKEEMAMMRDLQAVQSQSLVEEMGKSGKKTHVSEQSYGETYMKTAVLTTASIDDQMSTDANGERKMKIGKGSSATEAPEDAVKQEKPVNSTTSTAQAKTRLLQDATSTNAGAPTTGNSTGNATKNDDWKKLKKEEDYMRVIVNKKMFEKGGPLQNITKPVIMFNKHGSEYVEDFPRAKRSEYNANGTKVVKTKEQLAKENATRAAAGNETVEEDDYKLDPTAAQQVLELEFLDGETMEKIPIKNLPKGMLQICMMMKNNKQKLQYVNEDNEQFQEDGITESSKTQRSTQDETNQQERKGYEMCVDITHATTFATIDDAEAASSIFSYSMMVLMTLLAVLFFKQE